MIPAPYFTLVPTPLGGLLLTSDGNALTGLYLPSEREWPVPLGDRQDDLPIFQQAREQLAEYFAGQRKTFSLALSPSGTPFQERVWRELSKIPFGTTASYVEVARRIGAPGASRAVGAANGRNPISIVVPCHRVIGADGSLTGYGGGLDRKLWLLRHEGIEVVGN